MEQTKTAPASPSFVGLLAALAAPDRCSGPDRSEDGLADDVAELSYGSVRLRQVQAASGPRHSLQGPCDEEVISITEADQAADDDGRMRRQRVTLRLSGSEALQLRARAAESGLTVSAYLRPASAAYAVVPGDHQIWGAPRSISWRSRWTILITQATRQT